MSDFMEYAEYYKKAWELGLIKHTEEVNALRFKLAKAREALGRIDSECSRDDTVAWKIANDALEDLK